MTRAQRSDGPVIDIHCHRECAPAADFMRDAALAAGKVALGHGNATTRRVNELQLATIKPKMDDLEVRLVLKQRTQPGADEVLIIGEEHSDHDASRSGRTARTEKPSAAGPAATVPPSAAARSRMPAMPWPVPPSRVSCPHAARRRLIRSRRSGRDDSRF